MCTELGPGRPELEEFVIEKGGITLCNIQDNEGCSEKETEFITKWKAQSTEAASKELARLQKMSSGKMKPELITWLKQRVAILKQFAPAKEEL
mmetsp:Transcript_16666/g.39588  ORF Transcript_16666/g.39588 Transcript_16666/m.39588 type:complete len:93 (+) Transcript_16666:423-701(+)